MVDCGSGFTRVERYSVHEDGLVHLDHKRVLDAPTLHTCLVRSSGAVLGRAAAADHAPADEGRGVATPSAAAAPAGPREDATQAWVDSLKSHLLADTDGTSRDQEAPPVEICIGATAGVRDALERGGIRWADVEQFEERVGATLGPRANFAVMSGLDEAKHELSALRYCIQHIQTEAVGRAKVDSETVALVSSGGMSSQLVFHRPKPRPSSPGETETRCVSLPTKVKQGNAWALEMGVELGLQRYDAYLMEVMAAFEEEELQGVDGTHAVEGLRGTFVAIEMLGSARMQAGLGGRVVSVAEAKQTFEGFLREHVRAADHAPPEVVEERTWKDVVSGTQTVLALRLLSLLDPSARILFCREFELAPEHVLKPAWTLGCYLGAMARPARASDGHAA